MDEHCCEDMRREAARVCEQHADRFDCPDCLVHYSPKFREYGLIIHDAGTSFLASNSARGAGRSSPSRCGTVGSKNCGRWAMTTRGTKTYRMPTARMHGIVTVTLTSTRLQHQQGSCSQVTLVRRSSLSAWVSRTSANDHAQRAWPWPMPAERGECVRKAPLGRGL